MADLSLFLDRALSLATLTAPMMVAMALLLRYVAQTFPQPGPDVREEDPAPRWRLDR